MATDEVKKAPKVDVLVMSDDPSAGRIVSSVVNAALVDAGFTNLEARVKGGGEGLIPPKELDSVMDVLHSSKSHILTASVILTDSEFPKSPLSNIKGKMIETPVLDRDKTEVGGSKPLGLLKHIGVCAGWRFVLGDPGVGNEQGA